MEFNSEFTPRDFKADYSHSLTVAIQLEDDLSFEWGLNPQDGGLRTLRFSADDSLVLPEVKPYRKLRLLFGLITRDQRPHIRWLHQHFAASEHLVGCRATSSQQIWFLRTWTLSSMSLFPGVRPTVTGKTGPIFLSGEISTAVNTHKPCTSLFAKFSAQVFAFRDRNVPMCSVLRKTAHRVADLSQKSRAFFDCFCKTGFNVTFKKCPVGVRQVV